jgi:hypothetical protein
LLITPPDYLGQHLALFAVHDVLFLFDQFRLLTDDFVIMCDTGPGVASARAHSTVRVRPHHQVLVELFIARQDGCVLNLSMVFLLLLELSKKVCTDLATSLVATPDSLNPEASLSDPRTQVSGTSRLVSQ